MSPSRHALLRSAVALGLALAACDSESATDAGTPLGQLVSTTGTVTLTRGGQAPQPASPGPLLAGDLVKTGPASSALLRSADGRELELGEKAEFRVDLRLGKLTVSLQAGVISIVGGTGESGRKMSLALLTPFGETELAPGTKAKVSVESGGLGVDVAMGTITLVTEDGGARTAEAGQRLNLKMGSIEVLDIVEPAPLEPPPPGAPLVVRLAAEAGAPLLKKKGAPRFVAAPKELEALAEGTQFRVPGTARARVEAEGLRVRLSGAEGSFESSEREGARRRYRLKLPSGSAHAMFEPGETTLLLAGKRKELELKASGEAAATVVQTPKGPRLEVLAGEVEVVSGGQSKTVKAGEAAQVTASGVEVKPRPAPSLVLPLDRKIAVQSQPLGEVGLSLPAAPDARVEVASDAAFEQLVLASKVGGPYVVVPAPAAGSLFWRIVDATGNPLHKGQAKFEAERLRVGGDTPKSDVAETGLKSTVFFQSALPTLTFTFPAREGAQRYRMKVFKAANLNAPVVERDLSEPRGTVEAGTLTEGEYVWYAAPLDAAGNEQAGGRMNKLEIVYDNSLTTLVIQRPRPGEKAGPGGTAASGVAPLRTKLFVNGKVAPTDEKGRFSVQVPRGERSLVFRLVEPDGDERFWVRRLR